MFREWNKGLRIGIIGVGVSGVDACKFLVNKGFKDLTFIDRKSHREMADVVAEFEPLGIKFQVGEDYLVGLEKFNVLIKSPGVYRFLPELVQAEQMGVEITGPIQIFMENFPGKIIGVTGTKGKGTTCALIYHLMGKHGYKVNLAGNMGIPVLSKLENAYENDWIILELSSYQLQELTVSPNFSVVLNVTSDHLDVHRSIEEYVDAKKRIVRYQKDTDWAIINAGYQTSLNFAHDTIANKIFFSKKTVDYLGDNPLIGEHNLENVAAAVSTLVAIGVKPEEMEGELADFKPLPQHLELVREVNGVSYYNDSAATNPVATVAALRCFDMPVVLIVGGRDKKLDMRELGKEIANSKVIYMIAMGETGGLIASLAVEGGFRGEVIYGLGNMKEVVNTASKLARSGGVVLLSPGCSARGMFINNKDRGNQFDFWVRKLR